MVLALSIIYTKEEVKVYVCEHCGVKNSRHFLCVTTRIWVVLLIGRAAREICFVHSEAQPKSIWLVTGRQYEMSACVPQA